VVCRSRPHAAAHRCDCHFGRLFLAAIYLWAIGAIMLLAPVQFSLMSGAPANVWAGIGGAVHGSARGSGWALIAWGLFRLHNWARLAAVIVMIIGCRLAGAEDLQRRIRCGFVLDGLQIALRAAAAWYLAQSSAVIDSFKKTATERKG